MSEITTDDLKEMLRKRHPTGNGQWCYMEEVHDQTGYGRSRSCDAIAMSLWPSKGLELHGFEIKRTRADYLNELRDPDKSDTFKQYCDRWWLVASSRSIVQNDLPDDWGMLWARGGKLVTARGAPKLDPKIIPRDFLAALMRRAADQDGLRRAYHDGWADAMKRSDEIEKTERRREFKEFIKLKQRVRTFEERSGIRIDLYSDSNKLGAALEAVMALRARFGVVNRIESGTKSVATATTQLIEQMKALIEVCRAAGLANED